MKIPFLPFCIVTTDFLERQRGALLLAEGELEIVRPMADLAHAKAVEAAKLEGELKQVCASRRALQDKVDELRPERLEQIREVNRDLRTQLNQVKANIREICQGHLSERDMIQLLASTYSRLASQYDAPLDLPSTEVREDGQTTTAELTDGTDVGPMDRGGASASPGGAEPPSGV